jgi:hypothetical protein
VLRLATATSKLPPEFENYLDEPIRYKIESSRKEKTRHIKRRDCIEAEAHTFANRLLGKDGGLPKVMETKIIFGDPEDR